MTKVGSVFTRFEMATHTHIRKRKHPEAQIKTTKMPEGYEHQPAGRWEKLITNMNLGSIDYGKAGSTGFAHDPHAVWAALGACHFDEATSSLLVYMATGDRKARAVIWRVLLYRLIETREKQKWNSKKPGTLDLMATYAVYHVTDPHQYNGLSNRQWARLLDIADHKDFSKYWRPRYQAIYQYAAQLAGEGISKLEHVFYGRE